jgi:hypothetical protein
MGNSFKKSASTARPSCQWPIVPFHQRLFPILRSLISSVSTTYLPDGIIDIIVDYSYVGTLICLGGHNRGEFPTLTCSYNPLLDNHWLPFVPLPRMFMFGRACAVHRLNGIDTIICCDNQYVNGRFRFYNIHVHPSCYHLNLTSRSSSASKGSSTITTIASSSLWSRGAASEISMTLRQPLVSSSTSAAILNYAPPTGIPTKSMQHNHKHEHDDKGADPKALVDWHIFSGVDYYRYQPWIGGDANNGTFVHTRHNPAIFRSFPIIVGVTVSSLCLSHKSDGPFASLAARSFVVILLCVSSSLFISPSFSCISCVICAM